MGYIYRCGAIYDDERPQIDFQDPYNTKNRWLEIGDVLEGSSPEELYPGCSVIVSSPDASDWDCYAIPGTDGLFSHRAIEVMGLIVLRYFKLLPAILNQSRYYFLRAKSRVNCLDRRQSRFRTFGDGTSDIMDFQHFAFFENLVPDNALFKIPEGPQLFATESVAYRVRSGPMKGIYFSRLP